MSTLVYKINGVHNDGNGNYTLFVTIPQEYGTYKNVRVEQKQGLACEFNCVYDSTDISLPVKRSDNCSFHVPPTCSTIKMNPPFPYDSETNNISVGIADEFNLAIADALKGKENMYKIEVLLSGEIKHNDKAKKYVIIKHKPKK